VTQKLGQISKICSIQKLDIVSVVVLETMVLVSSGLEAKSAGLGLELSGLDTYSLGLGLWLPV